MYCTGGADQSTPECASSCAGDGDCDPSAHCDADHCTPDGEPGAACDEPSDCASALCVDTVCCATACDGLCERCDATGACVPIAAGADPDAECGAVSCAGYFAGFAGNDCLGRADVAADAAGCDGAGACLGAAELCPTSAEGAVTLNCPEPCQAPRRDTCIDTTAGACDAVDAGTQSCGTGECYREQPLCVDGEPVDCVAGEPASEVCDALDNDCDSVTDNGFADTDLDGMADCVDDDDDGDEVVDASDNCPFEPNADQGDVDQDGLGDACDDDADADGILNADDNCPLAQNLNQADFDVDAAGDLCDDDDDDDGVADLVDNCVRLANPDQVDVDENGQGDACDYAQVTRSLVGTVDCNPTTSLTGGFISGPVTWTHNFTPVTGVILSATLTVDIGDADGAGLTLSAGGIAIGTLTGGDNGGPGDWHCPDAWIGGADNTFTLPTSLYDDLKDGRLTISTTNDTGVSWWGANRAILTVRFVPTTTTSTRSVVGTESCNSAQSLTGGWISGLRTWTHSYSAIPGVITGATLTMDIGDGDGATGTLVASGISLGTVTGGDNGGPGTWQCPNAWGGGRDQTLTLPATVYGDLADGSFTIALTNDTGLGSWGSNRAILNISYVPATTAAVRNVVGTETCAAAQSLTGGWIDGARSWTHTYSAPTAPIVGAMLTVDLGDGDGSTLTLTAGGVALGTITGGDNGGPGTWACPNAWIGGRDQTLILPPSTYADLADGQFAIVGSDAAGLGTWGTNRAILQIYTYDPTQTDTVGTTNCTESASLTGGWTSGAETWSHSYTAIDGTIVEATLTVDIGDADLQGLTLRAADGTAIGRITGGDNGSPGTWQCPNAWQGGSDWTFYVPEALFDDLADGTFDVTATDDTGVGTWGTNRAILRITARLGGLESGTIDSVVGTETCASAQSLTGGWIDVAKTWTHTYEPISGYISQATLTIDIGDADNASWTLVAGGISLGTITGGDNGGPGDWHCPDAWIGGQDQTITLPATVYGDLADGSFTITTTNNGGVGWWGSNRAILHIEVGGEPPTQGALRSVVGTESCSSTASLTGGWIDTNKSWTHSFGQVPGRILSATLTMDIGDGDGVLATLSASGITLGTVTGGDNGGPGSWACPNAWIGGQDQTLTLPTSIFPTLYTGRLPIEMANGPALGWWGSNRAILDIIYEPEPVEARRSVVGTETCSETASLTGGWVDTLPSWTHTYAPLGGEVLSASLTIDIGDADNASTTLVAGGVTIGMLTGGDNGGPGTWACPNAWIGGRDTTFTIPPSLYDDLADGSFSISATNDTGLGWWGTNRAILNIVATEATNAPSAPAAPDPSDQDVGVPKSAPLAVTVSDPNGDPVSVTFYGRPRYTPPADFTLVALPDTQNYTCGCSGGAPATLVAQTDWIVAQATNLSVAFVTGLGDITEHGDTVAAEWDAADAAAALLEDPLTTGLVDGIPYGLALGNHDQTPEGASGTTALYNATFGADRFQGRGYYGGHYGSNNDNHYELFDGGGRGFLILHLEYGASAVPAILAWAGTVLDTYADRPAILVSHALLNPPGAFSAEGQAIYNALKSHRNLFLMLCGHTAPESRRTDTDAGHTVHTLMSDYQGLANGGDGYLRLMQFRPADGEVDVFTYSPTLDAYLTDAANEFTLPVDLIEPDYAALGTVDVASGETAGLTWPDLDGLSDYEWFVTVDDGTSVTTGPVWQFTTAP